MLQPIFLVASFNTSRLKAHAEIFAPTTISTSHKKPDQLKIGSYIFCDWLKISIALVSVPVDHCKKVWNWHGC